ncbi:MAG: hypothetical protein J6J35_04915 [Alphaproteobacteria bacterium]|nr:hypothetical protein [Alphaproteobacteria bacterium]
MKKCCINCAFCARYINNSANFLTKEEHQQALSGNFDFVGREQRAQKEWQNQYKRIYDGLRTGQYHDKLGGGRNVMEVLTHANNPDNFPIVAYPDPITELFGLPPYPQAPYKDFLVCMHDLWNFQGKEKEFPSLNQKRKCLFFYSYDKKGNKSFEGCEKEREALLAKSRFTTTNLLVIIGIIVTIVLSWLQMCNNKQSGLSQQNIETQNLKADVIDKK